MDRKTLTPNTHTDLAPEQRAVLYSSVRGPYTKAPVEGFFIDRKITTKSMLPEQFIKEIVQL